MESRVGIRADVVPHSLGFSLRLEQPNHLRQKRLWGTLQFCKHPDGLYWYHTLLTVCIKYKTMNPKRPKNLYAALTQQNVA